MHVVCSTEDSVKGKLRELVQVIFSTGDSVERGVEGVGAAQQATGPVWGTAGWWGLHG